jgi:hypothetical protein
MKHFPFFLLAIVFLSCKGDPAEGPYAKADTAKRYILPPATDNELYRKTMPETQTFTLQLKNDTSITCKGGTVITLPNNVFVDGNGDPVTENVTFKVVEVNAMSDFINANMQTSAGGELLQSQGMIYLNAESSGQSLYVDTTKALDVELPADVATGGFQIFTGSYDSLGNIDWAVEDTVASGMIPMPLSELDLMCYTWEKYVEDGDGFLDHKYTDSLVLRDKKYENTFVATAEFEERMRIFKWGGEDDYYYGWGWGWESGDCDSRGNWNSDNWRVEAKIGREMRHPILNLYLSNLDKPLWYCDSLAAFEARKIEIEDSTRWDKCYDKHDNMKWTWLSDYFVMMMKRRETFPVSLNFKGVDMSLPNAKQLLIEKGVTDAEAYRLVRDYKTQQRMIKRKQDAKRIEGEKSEAREELAKAFTTSFPAKKMGWYNVDRFMSDPTIAEIDFFATIDGGDALDFCDVNLILPNRDAAINAVKLSRGEYTFATCFGKAKLPVDDNAVLLAIGTVDGVLYAAHLNLKVATTQHPVLKPEKTTWEALSDSMEVWIRGY